MFPFAVVPALTAQLPPHVAKLEVSANQLRIKAGEIVEMTWNATGAEFVLLEPMGQRLAPQGRMIIRPEVTTTYWFSVVNLAGGETRPITITVEGTAPSTQAPSAPAPVPPAEVPSQPSAPVSNPDQAWVQVMAMMRRDQAERVVEGLAKHCTEQPVILEVPNPKGSGTIFRVRFGPYANAKEARQHLRTLSPQIKIPGSTPFVTVH